MRLRSVHGLVSVATVAMVTLGLVLVEPGVATATPGSDVMNNDGISDDGVPYTAARSLDLSGGSLSAQALAAAGYAPGSRVTVDGATFTMPFPNTAGADNFVAAGQTVPLPTDQQVQSTAIAFLVASTCGDSPTATAGLTYDDGVVAHQTTPAVTDWRHTPTGTVTPVVTLPYSNTMSGGRDARPVTLHAVFIPADPRKKVASVTLPDIGPADSTCANAALHVLAIAPRPVDAGPWSGTWAAPADGTVTPANGFADQTLRVIAHPSVPGAQARVRLSNTGSATPVTIDAASIAAQTSGAATAATPVVLRFGGKCRVTIPAGGEVYSDPVTYPSGGGSLAVSIHLPHAVSTAPAHTANDTVTYVAAGNATADPGASPFATTLASTYFLTGVDVTTTNGGTVAVLADQNTSSPGSRQSWGDTLATQLGPKLPGGLVTLTHLSAAPAGQNQVTLTEPRLRTVIVTIGAQDILSGKDSTTIETGLAQLMQGPEGYNRYRRPDGSAVRIVLATVPPLGLDPNDVREMNRQELNADITNRFKVYGANERIDLDTPVSDPANTSNVNPVYLTNGTPNNAYYQQIADTFATAIANRQVTL